ncbi:Os01g0796900 [Oryza sativa Japonica Group]|uniref:Os01g0796900 protein n=2 Tax=Oryza TaxID=4527 RepID=C7IXG6_ORYSJ|nr:Os01g0796900 [Oryza sativa Japonica Group]|eukprot:NP_001172603.1 Os01g0796900 [Oryza sativa Japonica Group]
MPAQKRPLQPADSDDSDGHVPVGRAASSRGGGGGVSHESDGEDAARRAREPPRDQRDGDPDEGDGGGGDGSGGGSDSESSLNGAGDKDELTRSTEIGLFLFVDVSCKIVWTDLPSGPAAG